MAQIDFRDFFSKQSKDYAKYRPRYPRELFEYISSLALKHNRAWDCATGNGQAALGLAEFFSRVVATDASEEQIKNAQNHSKIEFFVTSAKDSGLPDESFDLLSVATAAHWFNLEKFYDEAKRVLKPKGVIALWTYGGEETIVEPGISEILKRYSSEIVGPYFASEMKRVYDGYNKLPFPFEEIPSPPFSIKANWDFEQTMSYLGTWSATQKYMEFNKQDPRERIADDLLEIWREPMRKIEREWRLDLRVGRK